MIEDSGFKPLHICGLRPTTSFPHSTQTTILSKISLRRNPRLPLDCPTHLFTASFACVQRAPLSREIRRGGRTQLPKVCNQIFLPEIKLLLFNEKLQSVRKNNTSELVDLAAAACVMCCGWVGNSMSKKSKISYLGSCSAGSVLD